MEVGETDYGGVELTVCQRRRVLDELDCMRSEK
jgi:hypothetical protein